MRLVWHIVLGILGLYLATLLVPGVEITGGIFNEQGLKVLILAGILLGILNFFLKPILYLLTFPLRILTIGLFGLVIEMLLVFLIDVAFKELIIPGFYSLFWVSLIIWLLSAAVPKKGKIGLGED